VSDRRWDLLVIGGGTAGLVAAYTGVSLGARTALVERDRTGGDCLWTGCVPSKALLHAAGVVHGARAAAPFLVPGSGAIASGSPRVDMQAVMAHVRRSIAAIEPVDSPDALTDAGVTVLPGEATFTGADSVTVDGRTQTFERAVVATGASPTVPAIPGMEQTTVWTSESLWDLTTLPGRLLVIGGGSVGCELGQAFARLGSAVTLLEQTERLLPGEDADAADVVRDALRADGVDVRLGHTVTAVVPDLAGAGQAVISGSSGDEHLTHDAVLVAVGRTPRTATLGLDRAGVTLSASGAIDVTPAGRTANPRIWAAGDVTPSPHLTHLAAAEAAAAAGNALLGVRRRVDPRAVPRVTYTDPEVAAVGVTTDVDRLPDGVRVVTRHHDHVDRAITDGRTEGFARLAVERGGRVVGATVVGPRAGESIAELTLAVRTRTTVTRLADTVHAYPTYADGPWNAAVDDVRRRLAHPVVQRASRAVVALRRSGSARRARDR
jgi:pyruvate/2-oxoglutarate dehydrogenase complex dihydrolipoamide dehydrogenase (E3) component